MSAPVGTAARTVHGDVNINELGIVHAHEHLLIGASLPTRLEPDFLLDDIDVMEREIGAFTALGGSTLVDMMPGGIGRDPRGLVELSTRTGAHIIAATGFHKERYYDHAHWLYHYDERQIADLFAAEVCDGMDRWGYRGPLVERMSARAGVIKCATDYYRWTSDTQRWFTAAAIASIQTGAPIATHTEHGSLALEQAFRLRELGVPADSMIVGHADKNPDPQLLRQVADTGAFLQFDGPSRVKYQPDSAIVALLRHAIEDGYADRIVIGLDLARRSYYPGYGGGPGLGYLLGVFVPRLRAEGLDDLVESLLVTAPARALGFAPPMGSESGAERSARKEPRT